MNRKELASLFRRYHVLIPEKNGSNDEFGDLLKMIGHKEVDVIGLKDELYVYIRVVILDIKHLNHPDTEFPLRLVEKERMCKNGKMSFHRSDGVGKKVYSDEKPEDAALRCLEEKIGFVGSMDKLKPQAVNDRLNNLSLASFDRRIAGLRIITQKHHFEVIIPDELYKPDGYQIKRRKTNGDEVTSIFQWIPVSIIQKPKHTGH